MDADPDGKWVEVPKFSGAGEGLRLPPGHTEGTAFSEESTPENAARDVYGNESLFGAGLRRVWDSLTPGQDGQGAFVEAYSAYLKEPERLSQEQPDRYGFVKEHIFHGAEPVRFGYTAPGVSYEGTSNMVAGKGKDQNDKPVDSLGYPR